MTSPQLERVKGAKNKHSAEKGVKESTTEKMGTYTAIIDMKAH